MSNRRARRSLPEISTVQTQTHVDRARALKLGTPTTSHAPATTEEDRALTIREKIARWLNEKL